MPETPEELYERARRSLRMPPVAEWETFPFDGEMRPRSLLPLEGRERSRIGEFASDCWRCASGDEHAIWSDERWLLTSSPKPTGLPAVVMLFPRRHVDIEGLSDAEARELGPMLVRVDASVRSGGR